MCPCIAYHRPMKKQKPDSKCTVLLLFITIIIITVIKLKKKNIAFLFHLCQ